MADAALPLRHDRPHKGDSAMFLILHVFRRVQISGSIVGKYAPIEATTSL